MEISFVKRLRKIKDLLNKSLTDISNDSGLSVSFLSNIFWGKSNPNYEFFLYFAKHYHVNINWLLLGVGEMFLEDSEVPDSKEKFNTEREILKEVVVDLLTDDVLLNEALLRIRFKK